MGSSSSRADKMNDYLLDLKLKNLNQLKIHQQVDDIRNDLEKIDPEKQKHKYLTLSCIYGAFLGDSIGSFCEFSQPNKQNKDKIFIMQDSVLFLPGELTDDSEMAISAAFAYIDGIYEDPSRIQDLLYYYFCVWLFSNPKDYGNAVLNALNSWGGKNIKKIKFNPERVRELNKDSLANGFLMRISTFIVYYYFSHYDIIYKSINSFNPNNDKLSDEILKLYLDILKESTLNVEITHPNVENCISSAVFTLMVLTGMIKKDANLIYLLFKKIANSQEFINCHNENLKDKVSLIQKSKYLTIIHEIENEEEISVFNSMGYYIHAFKLSIYYLHKYPEMSKNENKNLYYEIMCDICNYGGDTDTNCAIVGTMVGPLIGYKNFKKEYFDILINFIPERRTQFNSAFMYKYVEILEEKFIQKKENNNNTKNKDKSNKSNNSKDGKKIKTDKTENKDLETKKENKGIFSGFLKTNNSKDNKEMDNFNYTTFQILQEFFPNNDNENK